MNTLLPQLLLAIVSYVTERGGSTTKTKLLKLLYLFDVEYYRVHGRTFTGFQWKYFHLGPWTREFDLLLEQLVSRGDLSERLIGRADFDLKLLTANTTTPLRRPFESYKDESILKMLLDIWASASTGEILDYVYFRTEPMEHGIRNESLDFSKIVQELPSVYKRQSSQANAGELSKLRRELDRKLGGSARSVEFPFTEPHYDEEFFAAMAKLDSGEI